jgi:carbonic anhydrase
MLAALHGCGEAEPPDAAAEDHGEVHWAYNGDEGPEHWAELAPEFSACADGREQSPIDLSDATPVTGEQFERASGDFAVELQHRATVLDLIDNGHTIQVTPLADIGMMIDGVRYGLAQYHFHAPSEHAIDGRRFPLEAHFVMSNADGELAVLGMLYEEGEHAREFDLIIASLPQSDGEARHLEDLDLDLEELKPIPERVYAYRGSLTTPPCSEGVRWFVGADPETMSAGQLEVLSLHLHDNARPLQPRGGRELFLVNTGR